MSWPKRGSPRSQANSGSTGTNGIQPEREARTFSSQSSVASFSLISRGYAIEPRWTALLGVLAAGAAGALTSELACPIQAPMHIMLWHIAPVVVSTAVGALVGTLVVERMLRLRP